MRVVGTAVVAGTIGAFFLLAQGGWIVAGTEQSAEVEKTIPRAHHKAWSEYNRFRDLQGMKVQNVDGERIGTLTDLVIDLPSGVPGFVIVRSGRFVGHRTVIVPMSAIALRTAKAGIAAVDVSKRKWRSAPEFSRKDMERIGQPGNARQIAQFYSRAENIPLVSRNTDVKNGTVSSTGREDQPIRPKYHLASELIGNEVIGRQQREVGTISDLLVDAAGMKPTFATVGAERRDAQFAVPLQMLRSIPDRKFVISANRQDFERAAPFAERVNSAAGGGNEIFRYER
jgi:sporulation protein YlmC with PRC-barrel domain